MVVYQPKIRKFNGNEDSAQWLKDYFSEIGGSGGPGNGMGHVYFCQCLEGAMFDWYCNTLDYKSKVYWNLLPATFSSHWDPITYNVHTLEILLSASPTFKDDVIVPPPQLPPTAESTTNQAQRTTSKSTKRKNGGKGEEEEERVRKEGDKEGFK